MDLLKLFKFLEDKDIRLSYSSCFIDNLTINDIVYSAINKEYYIFSEDTGIIIPEDLEFREINTSPGYYFAIHENGGLFLVSKMDTPIPDSKDEELDELDIELDFDESDFLEE